MKNKILNLFSYKYSFEIYCLIVCLMSFLSWAVMPSYGLLVLLVVGSCILFITNDIKLLLPIICNLVFTIGDNFTSSSTPYPIIIGGVLFVVSLSIFVIKNKPKLKLGMFFIPFVCLAILNIISIFWTAIDTSIHDGSMYLMYFNWLLYLLVYLIIVNVVNKDLKKELAIALSYLAILLALECLTKSLIVLPRFKNIFNVYYSLGWGICNEAGIMSCVALPFIFYLIFSGNKETKIINGIKIPIVILGILLTTSRASYLVCFVEIVLLLLYLVYKTKYRKPLIISACSLAIVTALILFLTPVGKDILVNVFKDGVSLNGRKELYILAVEHFTKNPLTVIFGDGMVNDFMFLETDYNAGFEIGTYRVIVYHSTFFQTLAVNGILGILFLGIHFIQKYKLIFKNKSSYTLFLFIGFICVDIYGLLDNTYHMYYYMIILMIILGISEYKQPEVIINEQYDNNNILQND